MEKDKIFFGEKGLTSTSANHVANLAKEMIQTYEKKLERTDFLKTEISLLGSSDKNIISFGFNEVDSIPDTLSKIAQAKSLIAWLREAIKARQNLLDEVDCLSTIKYCEIKGITMPSKPQYPHVLDEDEYYSSLSIKERNRFYQLQTEAAVLGKYIHPDGQLSRARAELKDKLNAPHSVEGNGRDTIIYIYSPTINPEKVDKLFFELQNKHREAQAQLNSIKFGCETAISQATIKANSEYNVALSEYNHKMEEIEAGKNAYIKETSVEISALKIVIPNSLTDIYNTVVSEGK